MLCIQKENYCSALFTHESGEGGGITTGRSRPVTTAQLTGRIFAVVPLGGTSPTGIFVLYLRCKLRNVGFFSSENVEIITVTVRIDSPIYYETKSLRGSNRVTRFAITGKTKDKQFETVALRSSSKRTPIATLHAMTRISAARQLGYGL